MELGESDVKLNKISNVLRVNRFNSKGTSALLSSAFVTLLAAPVYAEEQASTNEVAKESNIEVIEVSGMRGTMTRSLNEKKNTAAIVDAIAAADFGD